MHLPLGRLECCLHGGLWRGATPGHLQALPSEYDCNTYGLMPSLLRKGHMGRTDIVIRCIEVFQALSNPPHPMRSERNVFPLNIYAHEDSLLAMVS
jgi:hypothetical protein